MVTMTLRSVRLPNGSFRLTALSGDDGGNAIVSYYDTQTSLLAGSGGPVDFSQPARAQRLADNSNGGIEYEAGAHDPFDI